MKYKVYTQEHVWNSCYYIVEADSEEEIRNFDYGDLQDGFVNESFSKLDEWEITSIEPISNED